MKSQGPFNLCVLWLCKVVKVGCVMVRFAHFREFHCRLILDLNQILNSLAAAPVRRIKWKLQVVWSVLKDMLRHVFVVSCSLGQFGIRGVAVAMEVAEYSIPRVKVKDIIGFVTSRSVADLYDNGTGGVDRTSAHTCATWVGAQIRHWMVESTM